MPTDPLGLVGQVLLGRYRVEAPIAQGGMGVVYRGRDMRLRRPVCIKIFHYVSASEAIQRTSYEHFVQEAFALSQLSHPHTLRIYDFGHLEDERKAPFQVSELLEGGTLHQWIRKEGPRPPGLMLELLEPVGGALSEAHARGIIHRDIKPSNIFLAVLGTRRVAKLGDFGIAKTPGDAAPLPSSGQGAQAMRLYSPGWAAPEQLRGEAPAAATDVFSLALVTAFVLGGRPVFNTQNEQENLEERKHGEAHVAKRLVELAIPEPIAAVIRTATASAPFERFDSVELFMTSLREAITGSVRREGAVDLLSSPPPAPAPVSSVAPPSTPSQSTESDDEDDDDPKSVATSSLVLPASSTLPPPAADEVTSDPGAMRNFLRKTLGRDATFATSLAIPCVDSAEHLVFGRRLLIHGLSGKEQCELGGSSLPVALKARLRLTFLPSRGPLARINVKGLNCFVARTTGRPSPAVDVDADTELELLAPDRRRLDGVRCLLGKIMDGQHQYTIGESTLAISDVPDGAVLLDVGPGRELLLLHRGVAAARLGGRP